MNARRERFCLEYIKDMNAAAAARRAGYSAKTAKSAAQRLLTFVDVQQRIGNLKLSQVRRLHLDSDDVLLGLSRVGRVDPRKLFKPDSSIKLPHEWDDEIAAAVASFQIDSVPSGNGSNRAPIKVYRVKFWDRLRALEMLARHHNLYAAESKESSSALGVAVAQALEAGRKRMNESITPGCPAEHRR